MVSLRIYELLSQGSNSIKTESAYLPNGVGSTALDSVKTNRVTAGKYSSPHFHLAHHP